MNSPNDSSWLLGPFIRPKDGNPVLKPNPDATFQCPIRKVPVLWEKNDIFNPAAVVKDGKVYLLYRAEDGFGQYKIGRHTSRLGLAESADGIHFTKMPTPVVFPDNDREKNHEWPGGCEDPRLVEGENGEYILAYTEKDHLISRLGIATSKDLIHWTKHGLAFHKPLLPWKTFDTKAASIVCQLVDGRLKAVKIHGKYWMYWGVRHIYLASSEDLIHWKTHKKLLSRRPGYFDTTVAEAGPPALLTEKGIVLLYNAKNDQENGDPTLPHKLYTCGQILFDKDDLTKVLARTDHPFFQPELPWELTGQYKWGTCFIEGLVYFHEKWFLYYGGSDSVCGVAIWDPKTSKN